MFIELASLNAVRLTLAPLRDEVTDAREGGRERGNRDSVSTVAFQHVVLIFEHEK